MKYRSWLGFVVGFKHDATYDEIISIMIDQAIGPKTSFHGQQVERRIEVLMGWDFK